MVTIKHIARVIRGATLCSSNNIRVNRGRGRGDCLCLAAGREGMIPFITATFQPDNTTNTTAGWGREGGRMLPRSLSLGDRRIKKSGYKWRRKIVFRFSRNDKLERILLKYW